MSMNNLTKKEVGALAQNGFNKIPLTRQHFSDLDTPLSLYLKTANLEYSYLLESVEGGERFGRYSIIGLPAKRVYKINNFEISIYENGQLVKSLTHKKPLDFINELISAYKAPKDLDLPRFTGGLVGYFGYETIQYIEPKLLKKYEHDELDLPDILLMESEEVIVFDNLTKKFSILKYIADENEYDLAESRLDDIFNLLQNNKVEIKSLDAKLKGKPISNFGEENFKKAVKKIKEYIFEGDVMQVVLSQRQMLDFNASPISLYRVLRSINPSPYMFFYNMGDHFIVGASPEILVRLDHGKVTVRPIAGTRPRGKDENEDRLLEKDLLADPKEIAEHVQLMDLGRNDIGRVSEPGSVVVTDNMTIERYSHVMHIVSNVEGSLKKNMTAVDVVKATFPAGTVSGAPKVRAMEIINELESTKRGIYAGAVGYIDFDGDMDIAIAIRTGVIKDNKLYVQAGAGIVADSVPEKEWEETINKAKAVLRAAELIESEF